MAGFLAAVTQAPLTSFIIVMEMIDGHSMVLSLMACAMLASLVSRMISRPLYDTLAEYMVAAVATPPAPVDGVVPVLEAPALPVAEGDPNAVAPAPEVPESSR